MRRALAHHGNVMRKLERLADEAREERRAAERMGAMVYDLVPMDPIREEITLVGPMAARLPKILSVHHDDVMLFAETQGRRKA